MESDHYTNSRLKFRRRTFKRDRDMRNFLVPDTLFMHLEEDWDNCQAKLRYKDVLKGMKYAGFEWINCKADILPKIIATIGGAPVTAPYGIGLVDQEEQLLISENELRILVNGLYESVQVQKKEKMFDILILREIKGQLFWNWIFYFMQYGLPFDSLLPYNKYDVLISDYEAFKISVDERDE